MGIHVYLPYLFISSCVCVFSVWACCLFLGSPLACMVRTSLLSSPLARGLVLKGVFVFKARSLFFFWRLFPTVFCVWCICGGVRCLFFVQYQVFLFKKLLNISFFRFFFLVACVFVCICRGGVGLFLWLPSSQVTQLSKSPMRSPLAVCLLIRYMSKILHDDISATNARAAYQVPVYANSPGL